MILGIDINHWKVPINFDLVKQSGVRYIIVKATEGTSYIDTAFKDFWYNIKRINMPRGAFHYYRPTMNKLSQAKLFFDVASDTGSPPIIDVELYRGYSDDVYYYTNTPKYQKQNDLKSLLDFVEFYFKIKPVIYTGYYFWKDNFSPCPWAANYKLWIANYNAVPQIPPDWTSYILHQYTDKGIVAGIPTGVDMNKFAGNDEELYKFFRYTPDTNYVISTKECKELLILAGTLNVREYPYTTSRIVDTVKSGNTVIELEERNLGGNIWARVGVDQWIAKEYQGSLYATYKYV